MKKLLIPICAMLFCMTACQKENDNILILESEQYCNDAKLHLDGNTTSTTRYSVWDNNDSIWLNGELKTVSISGSKATISADGATAPYTAIYPYEWVGTGNTITYPAIQKYNGNAIKAPMAGYCADNNGTLKFHNLGSILVVNVTNTTGSTIHVQNIAVSADNSVLLTGTATITNLTSEAPSLSTLTSGSSTVTLNCGNVSIANNATESFYIALPPVDAKLTIKVYDDKNCYSKKQGTSHSMEQNHGYNASFSTTGVSICEFIGCSTANNQPINFQYNTNPFGSDVTYSQIYDQVHNTWVIDCNQTITQICGNAFAESSNKSDLSTTTHPITSIKLPNTVTTIKTDGFHFLTSLTSLVLSSSLTTIESFGISECISLETLVLPSSVTSLAGSAIFNPLSLRELIVESSMPPTRLSTDQGTGSFIAFDDNWSRYERTRVDLTIYVPDAAVDIYKAASGWSAYASQIQPISARPQ